ncbi:MAG: hypothetical protein R3C44_12985 [Chloroflexota bacterium]
MEKHRPFGVTLLALLAGIAALVNIWHTLQMLHIIPISLGESHFFTFDLIGAILFGLLALIYVWLFFMLWNVNPQGWLFVTILAILNLILAFLSILGQSTFSAMLPSLLINGLILLYCLTPGTRQAFGA